MTQEINNPEIRTQAYNLFKGLLKEANEDMQYLQYLQQTTTDDDGRIDADIRLRALCMEATASILSAQIAARQDTK